MSPTQTVIDAAGFMLQLPALGLVDPAGEWVTLRAACGTMEQCAELLATSNTSLPPLRATETEFGVVRAQFQSAMWSVPTIHAQRQAKPEIFRVRIKRQSPSALPADIERTRLPIDTEAIFLSKTTLKLEAASLPISQTRKFKEGFSVQATGPSMSDNCRKETLAVYRLCLNTTAAHSEQDGPPADPQAAASWQKQRRKRFNAAMDLWLSYANYCLNLGWMQGVADITKAGFDKATREWVEQADDKDTMAVSTFRVSPEEDEDFRGIDYALTTKGFEHVKEGEWRQLPLQAMDREWVRCGVNLARWQAGKKLFKREEWPPRPTTLMMKFGRK